MGGEVERVVSLHVDRLTARYGGVTALRDVSVVVNRGTIMALLGPNGAGKTTLLRAISGLVEPEEGRVEFEGKDISGEGPEKIVRLGLAHVPEGRGIVTELTVEENLRLGSMCRGLRGTALSEKLGEVYEFLPVLKERRHQKADGLSGGERQMLAIGRALMSSPRLLMLDEPTLGLAPRTSGEVMSFLKDMSRTTDVSVVVAEQNAEAALRIADDAVVLSLGTIALAGPAANLAGSDELEATYLGGM